jgi:hypothetical protein
MSAQPGAGFEASTYLPAARPHAPSPRFHTVRDLYESFASAAGDVGAPCSEMPALSFLEEALAAEAFSTALSFSAYLLPRREAVWWGAYSLRRMMRRVPGEHALDAAEAWVRRPEEPERREALRVGLESDGCLPATWIALAAGWSGGSLVPPQAGHVAAWPIQTPKAVRAALMIVLSQMPEELRGRLFSPCIRHALALARGDRNEA